MCIVFLAVAALFTRWLRQQNVWSRKYVQSDVVVLVVAN